MFHGADFRGDLGRPLQFDAMSLPVVEAERVALAAFCLRAHASTVEESRPPERRTIAFIEKLKPAMEPTRESAA